MHIKKQVVSEFVFPYAVVTYDGPEGKKVIVATEAAGQCVLFNADGTGVRQVWDGPGGTMTIWPIPGKEEFLATHEFYKGFQSKKAHLVHVKEDGNGGFICKTILTMPFLHRFSVVDIKGGKYFVGATLCKDKDFKDDWSKPGSVYVGKLSEDYDQQLVVEKVLDGVTKNHGMYCGPHDELKQVVMVTGVEGVFELTPPKKADGQWITRKLLDHEVSEVRCYDLDGDGIDELITIEKFHGDRLNIYHNDAGTYRQIYSYPVAFGHALWCGELFGKKSILIGYKESNAALLLLQRVERDGVFSMVPTLIDELESASNLDVWQDGESFNIYTACSSGKVVRYTLSQ